MSNDTMPCGCEGHADNAGLCRYPGLEAALAAERARREKAEDYLYEEQQAHTAALVRAETAERERDEARAALAHAVKVAAELHDARERAEADNAALLGALLNSLQVPISLELRQYVRAKFEKEPHPGAALLERVRSLEEVRRAAEPFYRWEADGVEEPRQEHWDALSEACAAARTAD